MKAIVLFLFLVISLPVYAANGTSVYALGTISAVFLGFFLYLVTDYTSRVAEEEEEKITDDKYLFFQKESLRPVLRKILYQSLQQIYPDAQTLAEGTEIVLSLPGSHELKIFRNGSVFVISPYADLLAPEHQKALASGLIVKTERGVYLPLRVAGFLAWMFHAPVEENKMPGLWKTTSVLSETISAKMDEALLYIDERTGWHNKEAFALALAEEFDKDRNSSLVLLQIHGSFENLLQIRDLLQGAFRNIFHSGGNTLGVFQSTLDMEKFRSSLPELMKKINRIESEVSLSVGSSVKQGSSPQEWYGHAEKALRHACIQGPDYFYQV